MITSKHVNSLNSRTMLKPHIRALHCQLPNQHCRLILNTTQVNIYSTIMFKQVFLRYGVQISSNINNIKHTNNIYNIWGIRSDSSNLFFPAPQLVIHFIIIYEINFNNLLLKMIKMTATNQTNKQLIATNQPIFIFKW